MKTWSAAVIEKLALLSVSHPDAPDLFLYYRQQ